VEINRRQLQLLLGGFWVFDGLLQLQPFMLGRGFAERVIAPAASGQPGFVAAPVLLGAHLIGSLPLAADLVFAAVQLAIGVLLVSRRLPRAALLASMTWGLSVWYLGEGAGGLASGAANLLSGAPGAALFYVLCAAAAWPAPADEDGRLSLFQRLFSPGRSELPVRPVARGGLVAVFVLGAFLQLLPANAKASTLAGVFSSGRKGAPLFLSRADAGLSHLVAAMGPAAAYGLAAMYLLVAVLLSTRHNKTAGLLLAGGIGLFAWLFGQAAGGLASGQATDPNTGVLVVLLALSAIRPRRQEIRLSLGEQEVKEPVPMAA
jgi:hypothetical protein